MPDGAETQACGTHSEGKREDSKEQDLLGKKQNLAMLKSHASSERDIVLSRFAVASALGRSKNDGMSPRNDVKSRNLKRQTG